MVSMSFHSMSVYTFILPTLITLEHLHSLHPAFLDHIFLLLDSIYSVYHMYIDTHLTHHLYLYMSMYLVYIIPNIYPLRIEFHFMLALAVHMHKIFYIFINHIHSHLHTSISNTHFNHSSNLLNSNL